MKPLAADVIASEAHPMRKSQKQVDRPKSSRLAQNAASVILLVAVEGDAEEHQ